MILHLTFLVYDTCLKMRFTAGSIALSALTSSVVSAATSLSASDACNFGPTHHSHLVLPLAPTAAACKEPTAHFLLSHGATFFCPHTFDVKLLATIDQDDARATLCDTHFGALAATPPVSSKVVLRPTLPAGGLPALARGELPAWTSPVMYHVHAFGKDNDAGPDAGWNVTTVRAKNTSISVVRVLYGRLLDIQPKPAALTYLAHQGGGGSASGGGGGGGGGGANPALAVLSHYISTSGTSGFDQLAKATVRRREGMGPVQLRDTWPLFLTVDGRPDALASRLAAGDVDVPASLHVYDPATGLPAVVEVLVTVTLDYYTGTSDGFAGYGTMCPNALPSPQSPTTCVAAN